MNKPQGYVCSYVSDSHKTVYELLPQEFRDLMNQVRGNKLHTVGRLDCETSGLLILTNDGYFSNALTRPQSLIKKTYRAKLKIAVSPDLQNDYIDRFAKGLTLPPEKKTPEQLASPSQLVFLSNNECLVTVHEGKFHQVRRMFLAVDNEVVFLERIKIGCLNLPQGLPQGKFFYFYT